MPTYYVYYRCVKNRKPVIDEVPQKFERPTDEEAVKFAQSIIETLKAHPQEPGLHYIYLRTIKVIDECFAARLNK